jgi:hypothetical protein
VANLAFFFIATQLFGDLFVLLILGLVAFFLATPVLAEREQVQRHATCSRAIAAVIVVPGTELREDRDHVTGPLPSASQSQRTVEGRSDRYGSLVARFRATGRQSW